MSLFTPTNQSSGDFFRSQYKKYTTLGFIVCGIFISAIVVSSTLIKMSGAITTKGTVVQIGENKSVQHAKGGPIKEILVEEGENVNKGDTLVILDSVSIDSQLSLSKYQEFELQLTIDRLNTMESGQTEFIIDKKKYDEQLTTYPNAVQTQQSLFTAQKNLFNSVMKELNVKLTGLDNEQKALTRQRNTSKRQLSILDESITELTLLYQRQLISKSRVTTTERDRVNVLTQLESLKVTQLQTKNLYNDTLQQIEKLTKENNERIWQEIEKAKEELAKVQSAILSTQDDSTRLEIKAPVSGKVHELAVNNINEVIKPGEPILQIVPNSGNFIVHAQVKPDDIEQLYFNQETRLRFNSFDQQNTPEITGRILFISADSFSDTEKGKGEKYFLVKVSMEPNELKKITNAKISSGLPVVTMFTTTERTLMNFLIKPLSEQLFSAFREN